MSGEKVNMLEGHTSEVNILSFSHNSKYILSASNDKNINLIEIINLISNKIDSLVLGFELKGGYYNINTIKH